jgi:Tfp pilus assembly protein PilZ
LNEQVGSNDVVDARRVHRRPTCWVAQLRQAQDVLTGAVLDISAHGAFFCPANDVDPDAFHVGQPVALAFESEPNLAGLDLPCRVRWIGFSAAHGRHGFGVEFTGGPIAA